MPLSTNRQGSTDPGRRNHGRWPLWRQIAVVLSVSVFAVSVLVGGLAPHIEKEHLSTTFHRNAERATALVSATAVDAVIVEDLPALQTVVEQSAAVDDDIAALKITNADGYVLAAWSRKAATERTDLITTSHEIVVAGQAFGTVMIEWDTETMFRDAEDHVRTQIFFVVASMLGMTAIFTLFGHLLVTASIGKIDRRLRRLMTEKKLGEENLPRYAARELLDLSLSVTKLAKAWEALEEAKSDLERRVEERTAELKNEITERKRTDEKTLHLQEELAHVDRLSVMGEMAAGLAHEINQPLAAVVNFAQGCVRRLRSGKTKPGELLDALEQISVQAGRAGEIIHRIRGFVGKEEPRMASVDVNAAIREATGLLEFEAREHAVTLNVDLANPLPKVRGNTIQIQQIILNLARNGMEAMSENGSTPRLLTIRSSATKSGTVEIAVHDNHYGVSTESLELLFESFLTTKTGGLGLVLSICRSIVESHGGRLWVTTDGVNDTAFRFTLPVA